MLISDFIARPFLDTPMSVTLVVLSKRTAPGWLKLANLRQYRPQTRTIMLRRINGYPASRLDNRKQYTVFNRDEYTTYGRFKFPWLSFGELMFCGVALRPYVFRHSRPWEDHEDAAKILVPFGGQHGSSQASICLGCTRRAVQNGEMTLEEAFWNTSFDVHEGDEIFQEQLLCTKKPMEWGNICWNSDQGWKPFDQSWKDRILETPC